MTSVITPLSRRPWWLWLVPLPAAAGAVALLADVLGGSTPLRQDNGLALLFTLALVVLSVWGNTSEAVTDYDADYLYWFTRTGTQAIALARFYRLSRNRGTHTLYYRNEQGRKKRADDTTHHGRVILPL